MKFLNAAALAAVAGTADAATFAVLRFTNKQLTQGRMDPIVAPGKISSHVHSVFGGSGFSANATGEDLINSKCSTANVQGDNSAYWVPSLYFKDPKTEKLESVEIFYTNVYYFFEDSDDKIEPFPVGLKIVGGDPWTRTAPSTSMTQLDPSKGDIQPVKWTCPRSNYDIPSYDPDSDGSTSGMGDPNNKGEGVGFPGMNCDGYASPLRADVTMPSCYNPEAGINDYKNNMKYPTQENGKWNCPQGWKHVPKLFYEIYWNTPLFKDRWSENSGEQPFVLSTGDVTGYSSHADFMSGWDTDVLQHIIDTCNGQTPGMITCAGVVENKGDCTIDSEVDEVIIGTEDKPLDELPGKNPFLGWSYGTDGLADLIPGGSDLPIIGDDSGDDSEDGTEDSTKTQTKPKTTSAGLPEASEPATQVVENASEETGTETEDEDETQEEPKDETTNEPEAVDAPKPTSTCSKNIKTAWETVYVTEKVYPQPTGVARRHAHGHGHLHGHRRSN